METGLLLSSRRSKWNSMVDVRDENEMCFPFVLVAKQHALVYIVVNLI
jgi:hypothetical protein